MRAYIRFLRTCRPCTLHVRCRGLPCRTHRSWSRIRRRIGSREGRSPRLRMRCPRRRWLAKSRTRPPASRRGSRAKELRRSAGPTPGCSPDRLPESSPEWSPEWSSESARRPPLQAYALSRHPPLQSRRPNHGGPKRAPKRAPNEAQNEAQRTPKAWSERKKPCIFAT
jgi:hypothetical protein